MELTAQKPGLVLQLNDLHQIIIRRSAADHQPLCFKLFTKFIIKFIAVTVALVYIINTIGLPGKSVFHQTAGIGAKAQGAALFRILVPGLHLISALIKPLLHQINHRMFGLAVKLDAVGIFHADGAGKFDHGKLHAQTNTKERNFILAGISDGPYLPLNAAMTKAAGHQNAMTAGQKLFSLATLQILGVHITEFNLGGIIGHTAMHKGLMQTLVGFGQINILTDNRDQNLMFGLLDLLHQILPGLYLWRPSPDIE